jgi:hypothetical protein
MVVALIALCISLGGVAYAGVSLSDNSVRSNHIANGQVRNADRATRAVGRVDVKDGAINSAKIADGGADLVDFSATAVTGVRGQALQSANDQEVDISGADTASGTVVQSLTVPAGSYAILAKAYINNDGGTPAIGGCRLIAGNDADDAFAQLSPDLGGRDEATLPMTLVHTFATAALVELRCNDVNAAVLVSHRKIVAIQLGSVTKTTS